MQALVCRGNLPESDVKRVNMSLNLEWVVFGMSRLLVPMCLFVMYRRGVFQESFQVSEIKQIFKICVGMHAMDLTGHFAMRQLT